MVPLSTLLTCATLVLGTGAAWLAKRFGLLTALSEPGPARGVEVALWAGLQLLAAAAIGVAAGPLAGGLAALVLLSPLPFFWRAGLFNRAWLGRDGGLVLLAVLPCGLVVLGIWRVALLAANLGALMPGRTRPAADHLILQLLLLLPATEAALRLSDAINPSDGVGFLSGAVLMPPSPELTMDGQVRPNVTVNISTMEFQTVVRTNELGLRGGPVTPKTPGEKRLLTLGDSFTMALEVDLEETFTERVAAGLSERGEPWVAWNAGMSGQSTPGAVEVLRRLQPQVQPDLVLLTFNLGNDLLDNVREDDPSGGGTGISSAPPPGPPDPWAEPKAKLGHLAAHSAFFSQLTTLALLLSGPEDGVVRAHAEEVEVLLDPAVLERLLPTTEKAIKDFEGHCRRTRIQCVIGLAPPGYLVHDERAGPTYASFGLDGSLADPQRQVDAVRAMTSVPVVDLTPALREASDERLYNVYDVHWTPAGHRVAAEAYLSAL